MLTTTFIALLCLTTCLAFRQPSALQDQDKRLLDAIKLLDIEANILGLNVDVNALVYTALDGSLITEGIVILGTEVEITTPNGLIVAIDLATGLLVLRPKGEKVCMCMQMDDNTTSQMPSLAEIKALLVSGAQISAPDVLVELHLVQSALSLNINLPSLARKVCGSSAPLFVTPVLGDLAIDVSLDLSLTSSFWSWFPWGWSPKPCDGCTDDHCFQWPFWFYIGNLSIMIKP